MRSLFNTGCFVLAFLLTCVIAVACDEARADKGHRDHSISAYGSRDLDFEIDMHKPIPRDSGCNVVRLNKAKNAAVIPVYEPGEYENAYAMIMVIVKPGVRLLACRGPQIWFQQDGEES